MIWKKGKLPGELYSEVYELEYGKATIQIQKVSIGVGLRVVIIDVVFVTGGTSIAMVMLI